MGSGMSIRQYDDFFEGIEDSKIRIRVEVESKGMFRVTQWNGHNKLDPVSVPKSEIRSFILGAVNTAVLHRVTLLFDEESVPLGVLTPGRILASAGLGYVRDYLAP